MLTGFDVSHWDGKIDWARVMNAGIGFAYIKATEGTNFVDAQFAHNLAGAKDVGLPFGLYRFLRPDINGAAQAEWFLRHAGGLSPLAGAGRTPPATGRAHTCA